MSRATKHAAALAALLLLALAATALVDGPAAAQDKAWVTARELNRHSCPDPSCPVVGQNRLGDAITMYERLGKWVRISAFNVDPGCADGRPALYVRQGSRACLAKHGYREDGSFAEWVQGDHLTTRRPGE